MKRKRLESELLIDLQRSAFRYFSDATQPANGLVRDTSKQGAPCSIAVTGLGFAVHAVAVERGFEKRSEAARGVLKALRFFESSEQGNGVQATGYKGFYYHFLDAQTGRRVGDCELSTIDSAFLFAGMLLAAAYFDAATSDEREIRRIANALYARADWRWACDGGATLTYGYRPERGFIPERWEGYSEGLFLYALALGAPTHSLPASAYDAWTKTYEWKRVGDIEYLHAGPLFIHQISQTWLDFRGLQDAYMRKQGIDYFENSRRATYVQQAYALANPHGFLGYGENRWGLTACDGPGPKTLQVKGKRVRFYDYRARGVPLGPDDGTLSPRAAVASLPFAPEIALPALEAFSETHPGRKSPYGYMGSINETFGSLSRPPRPWVSKTHYGLDHGTVMLMVENYRSGLIWRLMRGCAPMVKGLERAGFRGGWLGH